MFINNDFILNISITDSHLYKFFVKKHNEILTRILVVTSSHLFTSINFILQKYDGYKFKVLEVGRDLKDLRLYTISVKL